MSAIFPPFSSGVPGLDTLMGGGIPTGSLLMILGRPGTGKTTLTQQLCFAWARAHMAETDETNQNPSETTDSTNSTSNSRPKTKPRALYFSLLSEPHDKLISHMSDMTFFDSVVVGDQLHLLSLSSVLEQGLDAAAKAIVKSARELDAGFVAIDGLGAVSESGSGGGTLRFLYTLTTQLGLAGITTVIALQTEATRYDADQFLTSADGVISLESRSLGARRVRRAEIYKMRGLNNLLGAHTYTINNNGLTFYPRLESIVNTESTFPGAGPNQTRVGFDLPELEEMLGGGVLKGNITILTGSLGTGKTVLGMHYLMAGIKRGEAGLYIGFSESRTELVAKAERLGMGVSEAVANGMLTILTFTGVGVEADVTVARVREMIDTRNVQRVVVDSFIELDRICQLEGRSAEFAAAFASYLKERAITTLVTYEMAKIIGIELDVSQASLASMADNMLLLRHVEYRSQLYRVLSVLKMRDSNYDTTIREFAITHGQGLKVLRPFQSAEGVLTGLARQIAETAQA